MPPRASKRTTLILPEEAHHRLPLELEGPEGGALTTGVLAIIPLSGNFRLERVSLIFLAVRLVNYYK